MAWSNGGDDFDEGEDTPIQTHMRRIGRLGGLETSYSHGSEHFQDIGHIGGKTTLERHGREYYVELGKKGGLARAAKRNQNQGST
jgi:general stress protein YciG